MLNKAISIATRAHKGQFRKNSGLPYIVHPLAVMQILIDEGVVDHKTLAAAVLHDVIEDCDEKYEDEIYELNLTVHYYVSCLTKEESFVKTCLKLENSPMSVQLIKCADIYHNTKEVLYPEYIDKKIHQMEYLRGISKHPLYEKTMRQLRDQMVS